MKITIFNGSPKGARGNTHAMVEAFIRGAQAAGAETDYVLLSKCEIKHCTGCLSCWTRTPGVCVIKDDMKEIIEKYKSSDLVMMATPLYVDNVSGMTKVLMDRLLPIVDPHFEDDENGETAHRRGDRVYPGIIALSCCGFPEQSQFQALELLFRRVARNMGAELVAEIYKAQGNLLTIPNDMLKPLVDAYLKNVEKAAAEIVTNGKIPEALTAEMTKQFLPREMYVSGANKHWDSQLAKAAAKAAESDKYGNA